MAAEAPAFHCPLSWRLGESRGRVDAVDKRESGNERDGCCPASDEQRSRRCTRQASGMGGRGLRSAGAQVARWGVARQYASPPDSVNTGRGGKPFLFLRHQVPDSEQPSFAFDPSPAPLRASS